MGKQALRFTSGSFAFRHFQLHYINLCFIFASRAEERKVEHRCIDINLGSGLRTTNWAVNPICELFIILHYPDERLIRQSHLLLAVVIAQIHTANPLLDTPNSQYVPLISYLECNNKYYQH